ncbi:MAG: response regulator transcription factor [Microbacterium sp.]
MTTRVLLVDDDPLVLAGLRMMLAGDAAIEVAGEATDGEGLVETAAEVHPDVILMDIRMPRLDGIAALRDLRSDARVDAAVIMLTTFDTEAVVLEALRAGASGFLLKHTPPEQIIAAIHAAAAGEATLSPLVLRQLIDRVTTVAPADSQRLRDLTPRERDVADAVADGLSNSEIAEQLHLSVGSVKTHISSALAKLGIDNRVQLAIAAYEARSL